MEVAQGTIVVSLRKEAVMVGVGDHASLQTVGESHALSTEFSVRKRHPPSGLN